jgi:hypothetical protein
MPAPVARDQLFCNLCSASLIEAKVSSSATFETSTSLTATQQFYNLCRAIFFRADSFLLRRQFSSLLYLEQEEEIPERMPMQVLPVGGIYTAIEEEKRRKLEEARRKELEERAKKEGGCPTCCQKVR